MLRKLITGIWRTLAFIFMLVTLAVFVAVPLAVYYGMFYQAPPTVHDNSALVWVPHGTLVEQHEPGLNSLVANGLSASQPPAVVSRLIRALDDARSDDRIKKAYLKLDELGGAQPGQLQDLVAAIDRFRQSGKRVIAWADDYDQARYELASHASRIDVDPMGGVLLPGYGVYRDYFKDAIDDLGIQIHVFRHGKYKSFVEPFIRNDMSPAARKADKAWTQSLWSIYAHVVAKTREIDADDVLDYADHYPDNLTNARGNGAKLALDAGLVDQIDTWRDASAQIARPSKNSDQRVLHAINDRDYLAAADAADARNTAGPEIVRIVVAGDINSATGQGGSADSHTIETLFARTRQDADVKAVVLRVNSPGGAIGASESIRRQVVRTQAAGKPVVVSMAGMAASGGYWISMNADQIWAEPSTITGSIGVFGMVPTFEKPLKSLGIHTDGVGTTTLSDGVRIDRALEPAARKIMKAGIDHAYRQFVGKVASARGLAQDKVQTNAQGRVWSGADAKRIGLVDHLGGLVQAQHAAAKLAGLKAGSYTVETITPPSPWNQAIHNFMSAHVEATWLPGWLRTVRRSDAATWLTRHLTDPRGRYARCFCRVTSTSFP